MIEQQNIEQYHIITEIGRTEHTVLFQATDSAGRPVLLQRFLRPLPHEDVIADLRWTSGALSRLERDDVIRVTGWGVDENEQLSLLLEHADGLPLSGYMKQAVERGRVARPDWALRLVLHLAQTLEAALRLGMVHKDFHPQQVLLDAAGRPWLLNLDLPASAVPAGDADGRYHSPEQQQERALDGRSNIYSLGALLYDLLAGNRPDVGADNFPPLADVRPGLPEEVYQVVSRALEPQSWARYRTWEDFIEGLAQALAAVSADPAFATGISGRWGRGRVAVQALADIGSYVRRGMVLGTMVVLGVLMLLAFLQEGRFRPVAVTRAGATVVAAEVAPPTATPTPLATRVEPSPTATPAATVPAASNTPPPAAATPATSTPTVASSPVADTPAPPANTLPAPSPAASATTPPTSTSPPPPPATSTPLPPTNPPPTSVPPTNTPPATNTPLPTPTAPIPPPATSTPPAPPPATDTPPPPTDVPPPPASPTPPVLSTPTAPPPGPNGEGGERA